MRSFSRGPARGCLLLALVIPALLMSSLGPASAAEPQVPPAPSGLDMSGLSPEVRQGIERGDIAIAPMTLETAPDGDEASTQSAVRGNCGWVYFWIRNHGRNTLNLRWGFYQLCFRATAYQWSYFTSGPSFWRYDSGGGGLFFRREVAKTWNGARGGLGWYEGCATLWAQNGPRAAKGIACDSFPVSR